VRTWSILASLVAAIVGLCSAFRIHLLWSDYPYFEFRGQTNDAVLRKCLDASGLLTPQDNLVREDFIHDWTLNNGATSGQIKNTSSVSKPQFRLLCTTTTRRILWGSYKLRCIDLKQWARRCAQNVEITVGIPLEYMEAKWKEDWPGSTAKDLNSTSVRQQFHSNRDSTNHGIYLSGQDMYNATIFFKALSRKHFPQYGNLFIDMVDEYSWTAESIPRNMHLIFQTQWQGPWHYPKHHSSIVEHWYNSYPADSGRLGSLPEYLPTIQQRTDDEGNSILEFATIWNTERSKDPTEGGCPSLTVSGVKYHCLNQDFDITTWYLDFFKHKDAQCDMARTLANPLLGEGKLYFNMFQKFDALVVLAKNHTMKLHFGNVQRGITQMRSGVPVLMEIRGSVLEDFMNRYNYTCAFQRYSAEPSFVIPDMTTHSPRRYWTFNEAVEQMKKVEIRRECQRQALEIVQDYSQSAIGQKFLRVVGYDGEFEC
jgi:hypothetical protein